MDMTKQHTDMETLWKIAVVLNQQTEETKKIIRDMHYEDEMKATVNMLRALEAFNVCKKVFDK